MEGCDYATITGRTRKAQPPEECTYFVKGGRIEPAKYDPVLIAQRKNKNRKKAGVKPKHDWEYGKSLYERGFNDGEIARKMNITPQVVCQWRQRNDLPANTNSGGRRIVRDLE